MRHLLLAAGDSQLQVMLCSVLALSCWSLEAGLTCRLLRSAHRRHPLASWSLPAFLLLWWSTSVTSEISFEPLRNRNTWELVYAVETLSSALCRQEAEMGLDPDRITLDGWNDPQSGPRRMIGRKVNVGGTDVWNLSSGKMFQVRHLKKKGNVQGPKKGDLAWFSSPEWLWVWGIPCPSLGRDMVLLIISSPCFPPQGSWRKVTSRTKWNLWDSGRQQQSPQPWVNCAFLSAFNLLIMVMGW